MKLIIIDRKAWERHRSEFADFIHRVEKLIGNPPKTEQWLDNEHDPQAIAIETSRKEKIGYVPRQDNVIFSRLMDAGKNLFAKVEDKEMRGKWARIKIKIYLNES